MSDTGTNEIPPLESLARRAYDAYCASVGGRAFNGDPLPSSLEFFTDPNKVKQAQAWLAATASVVAKLEAPSACRDPETGALPDALPKNPAGRYTVITKTLRQNADRVLQDLKVHLKELEREEKLNLVTDIEDRPEALAQLILARRDFESGIMRLGMVLKNIGATPNPYPQSYNPSNPVIEKTADGVKL